MTPLAAWRGGLRRVGRSPSILAGVWAATVAVSLPLTIAMKAAIEQQLGASLAADTALSGVNYVWWQEFMDQASGMAATFRPTILGFGAVLSNLSGFLDNTAAPLAIAVAAACYLAGWQFLAGGIIDRYARDRAARARGFFGACGAFFFRFLRLAVVTGIVYGLLFGAVHGWLFDSLYGRATYDMASERTAFALRATLYALFLALAAACSLVFDYAKVRLVVEDRRSVAGAIAASLRFVRDNAGSVTVLYLANVVLFLVVLAAYALVAPGAGRGGWTVWTGFAIGQLYIAARLAVKLAFWASATTLFQSRFAHAGYVAAPAPEWPESAAVEAIIRS